MKKIVCACCAAEESVVEIVGLIGDRSVVEPFGVAEEGCADEDESEIPGQENFLICPKLFAGEQLEIRATSS